MARYTASHDTMTIAMDHLYVSFAARRATPLRINDIAHLFAMLDTPAWPHREMLEPLGATP